MTQTYHVETIPTGGMIRRNTGPDGTTIVSTQDAAGQTTILRPDGTSVISEEIPDPRFGYESPIVKQAVVTVPSGLTITTKTDRIVDLSEPTSPLSLISLTETTDINGQVWNSEYTTANRTWVDTSPEGRITTTILNNQGRISSLAVPELAEVHFNYDGRGRLSALYQGTGADERRTTYTYHESGPEQGFLQSVTDSLGRTAFYNYDAAGRLARQELPDGREIFYGYDAGGNLTSVTPPGRSAHLFNYTGADMTSDYLPPELDGLATTATVWEYDLDKRLTRVSRPDGQENPLIMTIRPDSLRP